MKTKQRVLDIWIEKGAVYGPNKIVKSETQIEKVNGIVIREIILFVTNHFGLLTIHPRDILYHPTSNLREVMFPDKTMTKPTIGRKNISVPMHHKMNSLLSEDPRDYIATHSPLFADDNNE